MEDLSKQTARTIIERVGSSGQPPDYGFQYFSVGLDPYLRVIEDEYLASFIPEGGSSFKLVVGPYGGGKTHLLFSVREIAWNRGFVTSYIQLSPESTPFHRLDLVYASIVRAISPPQSAEELLSGQSKGIASLLISGIEDRRRALSQSGVPKEELTAELIAWVRGFSRFDSVSFQRAVRLACEAIITEKDDDLEAICQWLQAEGLDKQVKSKFGILQKIDKTSAFPMIRCLVQLARELGYAGLVVLLDEAELSSSLRTKQRETLLSNLRETIDECGQTDFSNAMFFYAVPDENFLEGRGMIYQALSQRLSTRFERANPAGVKMILDDLWDDPLAALAKIGEKLQDIYEIAYDFQFPPATKTRIKEEAQTAYDQRYGDIGYKRLFVENVIKAFGEIRSGRPEGATG